MRAKRAVKDEPYTSNYPALQNWLDRIGARCAHQLPIGDSRKPQAYLEMWHANGKVFCVWVRADNHGWDIFTGHDTNDAGLTFDDAETRLDIKRY